jgi:hypothetical protein
LWVIQYFLSGPQSAHSSVAIKVQPNSLHVFPSDIAHSILFKHIKLGLLKRGTKYLIKAIPCNYSSNLVKGLKNYGRRRDLEDMVIISPIYVRTHVL